LVPALLQASRSPTPSRPLRRRPRSRFVLTARPATQLWVPRWHLTGLMALQLLHHTNMAPRRVNRSPTHLLGTQPTAAAALVLHLQDIRPALRVVHLSAQPAPPSAHLATTQAIQYQALVLPSVQQTLPSSHRATTHLTLSPARVLPSVPQALQFSPQAITPLTLSPARMLPSVPPALQFSPQAFTRHTLSLALVRPSVQQEQHQHRM